MKKRGKSNDSRFVKSKPFNNSMQSDIRENLLCYHFPWPRGWNKAEADANILTVASDHYSIISIENNGLWILIKQGNPLEVQSVRVVMRRPSTDC